MASLFIQRIKISNFLSFCGCYEVNLEPFTAIMCNFSEGREDMLRAFEFVCGSDLEEIFIKQPKNLLSKCLWKSSEEGREFDCFVEISLKMITEGKTLQIHRRVKNDTLEHIVDGKLVSHSCYEEVLDRLNIRVKQKNIVFRKALFGDVIWGTSEELENIITRILRVNSNLESWKKIKQRIKYIKEKKESLPDMDIREMKKSHGIVNEFTDVVTSVVKRRDDLWETTRKTLDNLDEEELPVSPCVSDSTSDEINPEEVIQNMEALEEKENSLLKNYNNLELKYSQLQAQLYYYEVKISSQNSSANILQERILKLKVKLREQELSLSSLWAKILEVNNHLNDIGKKICQDVAALWDIQQSSYLRNRFTVYGRFKDYLWPNKFAYLLPQILGEYIYNANLCDNMETAVLCLERIKSAKYERREGFVIFDNYSGKLKELLLSFGEKGIKLHNVQELQIFLCKLKQYELIKSVPIIIKRRFHFELGLHKTYNEDVIYPNDGIFLHSNGCISYFSGDTSHGETEEEITERLNLSLCAQELKFEECRDYFHYRLQTLHHLNSLENDILELKSAVKTQRPRGCFEPYKMPDSSLSLYENYINLFEAYDKSTESSKIFEESTRIIDGSQSLSSDNYSDTEKLLQSISSNLDLVEEEKSEVKENLLKLNKKLSRLSAFSNKVCSRVINKYTLIGEQKRIINIFYDKELEDLKKLMSKDEIDDFMSWKHWRQDTIESLYQDARACDNLLRVLKKDLEKLTAMRKRVLSPFLEHCSLRLSSTLTHFMDTSLPFLDLTMKNSEDGLQLLSSLPEESVNIIEVQHFNTFLKCIATLTLFLEVAVYDKIPIILLDDIHDFLPMPRDTLEAVLDKKTLSRLFNGNENNYFQLLTRIAQYLNFFISKNSSGNSIRKNGKRDLTGPIQIIYFTSDDLANTANQLLWIRNNVLPDEFISEDCDSYSSLEEICL